MMHYVWTDLQPMMHNVQIDLQPMMHNMQIDLQPMMRLKNQRCTTTRKCQAGCYCNRLILSQKEPLSDEAKKQEEEEDEDILFCSYMVPSSYTGKRKADIQAVTIANIKQETINEDYYKYATDNLSQQMQKLRLMSYSCFHVTF